nr:unnamed protein product [Callosobruchus chinensis]
MSEVTGISRTSIQRILKHYKWHPYKIQLLHELNEDDHDRRFEQKIEKLCESRKKTPTKESVSIVENISSVSSNKDELSLSNKGLNFAPPAPRANPEEVVVGVQSSIQQLLESSKGFVREAVRSQICEKISTCNLSVTGDRKRIDKLIEEGP